MALLKTILLSTIRDYRVHQAGLESLFSQRNQLTKSADNYIFLFA